MLTSWFKSPENSPPALLCSPPTPSDESPTRPGPGFAKKRWLRQAISEECDSPNSRPGGYILLIQNQTNININIW